MLKQISFLLLILTLSGNTIAQEYRAAIGAKGGFSSSATSYKYISLKKMDDKFSNLGWELNLGNRDHAVLLRA